MSAPPAQHLLHRDNAASALVHSYLSPRESAVAVRLDHASDAHSAEDMHMLRAGKEVFDAIEARFRNGGSDELCEEYTTWYLLKQLAGDSIYEFLARMGVDAHDLAYDGWLWKACDADSRGYSSNYADKTFTATSYRYGAWGDALFDWRDVSFMRKVKKICDTAGPGVRSLLLRTNEGLQALRDNTFPELGPNTWFAESVAKSISVHHTPYELDDSPNRSTPTSAYDMWARVWPLVRDNAEFRAQPAAKRVGASSSLYEALLRVESQQQQAMVEGRDDDDLSLPPLVPISYVGPVWRAPMFGLLHRDRNASAYMHSFLAPSESVAAVRLNRESGHHAMGNLEVLRKGKELFDRVQALRSQEDYQLYYDAWSFLRRSAGEYLYAFLGTIGLGNSKYDDDDDALYQALRAPSGWLCVLELYNSQLRELNLTPADWANTNLMQRIKSLLTNTGHDTWYFILTSKEGVRAVRENTVPDIGPSTPFANRFASSVWTHGQFGRNEYGSYYLMPAYTVWAAVWPLVRDNVELQARYTDESVDPGVVCRDVLRVAGYVPPVAAVLDEQAMVEGLGDIDRDTATHMREFMGADDAALAARTNRHHRATHSAEQIYIERGRERYIQIAAEFQRVFQLMRGDSVHYLSYESNTDIRLDWVVWRSLHVTCGSKANVCVLLGWMNEEPVAESIYLQISDTDTVLVQRFRFLHMQGWLAFLVTSDRSEFCQPPYMLSELDVPLCSPLHSNGKTWYGSKLARYIRWYDGRLMEAVRSLCTHANGDMHVFVFASMVLRDQTAVGLLRQGSIPNVAITHAEYKAMANLPTSHLNDANGNAIPHDRFPSDFLIYTTVWPTLKTNADFIVIAARESVIDSDDDAYITQLVRQIWNREDIAPRLPSNVVEEAAPTLSRWESLRAPRESKEEDMSD